MIYALNSIESPIIEIGNQPVILDSDVAAIHGVKPEIVATELQTTRFNFQRISLNYLKDPICATKIA